MSGRRPDGREAADGVGARPPDRQVERAGRASAVRFGRRAAWWIGGAGLAFAVTLFFYVFGEAPAQISSPGANTFSRSALGYHALVSFLGEAGGTVRVSRFSTAKVLGPEAGLLLLAPPGDAGSLDAVRTLVGGAIRSGAPIVVVLPEWHWRIDPDDRSRVKSVEPVGADRIARLLGVLLAAPAPDLAEGAGHWMPIRPRGPGAGGGLGGPLAEGLSLELVRPQVLPADLPGFEPLVEIAAGPVIAVDPARRMTIVADPDLFNTHGLGRGDNAALARRLLVDGGQGLVTPETWVVDETLHGFERVPSLTREMLELPLVFFTLQAALLAVLATWAAARRFGKALPAPPRLAAGAWTLIDNTARLLAFGGHHAEAVERYLDVVLADGAAAFGVPARLGRRARVARLAEVAANRGASEDLEDIVRRIAALRSGGSAQAVAARSFNLARRLWRWRGEVLDGARLR